MSKDKLFLAELFTDDSGEMVVTVFGKCLASIY